MIASSFSYTTYTAKAVVEMNLRLGRSSAAIQTGAGSLGTAMSPNCKVSRQEILNTAGPVSTGGFNGLRSRSEHVIDSGNSPGTTSTSAKSRGRLGTHTQIGLVRSATSNIASGNRKGRNFMTSCKSIMLTPKIVPKEADTRLPNQGTGQGIGIPNIGVIIIGNSVSITVFGRKMLTQGLQVGLGVFTRVDQFPVWSLGS